jgi:DNA-binding SARP family transcriptional activator
MTVGILGPMEVSVDGEPVGITTGRLRALLAALAVSAPRTVSVDRLSDVLWGRGAPDLPAHPRRTIQTYMTRLRTVVGANWIRTAPAGYLLDVEPDRVDALRFVRLLDEPCGAPSRQRLAEALNLWRGEPFEDVPSPWLEQAEVPRLVELYLVGVERLVELDMAEGRHQAIAELGGLTARFPLRESLWVRYLVMLEHSGRRAEAIGAYERARRHIADELGVDPGPQLRRVHADLLADRSPSFA